MESQFYCSRKWREIVIMLFNLDEKIYVNGEYITYKKLGEILEEEPLNLYMKVKYFGKNGRDLVEGDKPIEPVTGIHDKGRNPK